MKLILIVTMCVLSIGCASTPYTMTEAYSEINGALDCKVSKCTVSDIEKKITFKLFRAFNYTLDSKNYKGSFSSDSSFLNGYNSEYWNLLPESGKGDCEDYVLTLRKILNESGITGTYFVFAKVDGVGHAALEVNGWIFDISSPFAQRKEDLENIWGWKFISVGDESGKWFNVQQNVYAIR